MPETVSTAVPLALRVMADYLAEGNTEDLEDEAYWLDKARDHLRPLEEAGVLFNPQLVASLRRLVDLGPAGHRLNPVEPQFVDDIEAANRADSISPHRSTECWDCAGDDFDSPMGDGKTSADHWHEAYQAWSDARALLQALVPQYKSSTSCRVCGHWIEGDYNMAPAGLAGDFQRAKAEREMDNGACDTCRPLRCEEA